MCFSRWIGSSTHRPFGVSSAAKMLALFEYLDERNTYCPDPVVLAGSSTIERYKTAEYMCSYNVINRGVSGTTYKFVRDNLEELVLRYDPSSIIFYSGDNDIVDGHPVDQIALTVEKIIERIRDRFGTYPAIIIITPKVSPARVGYKTSFLSLGDKLRYIAKSNPKCYLVDTSLFTLGANGEPLRHMYERDGLHFSSLGYEALTRYLTFIISNLTGVE